MPLFSHQKLIFILLPKKSRILIPFVLLQRPSFYIFRYPRPFNACCRPPHAPRFSLCSDRRRQPSAWRRAAGVSDEDSPLPRAPDTPHPYSRDEFFLVCLFDWTCQSSNEKLSSSSSLDWQQDHSEMGRDLISCIAKGFLYWTSVKFHISGNIPFFAC